MKSGKNKTLKTVAATMVTLFSLVTVFTATIAWIAANKDVDSNAGEINVTDVSRLFSKMTLHQYLGKDSGGNLLFSQTPGGSFSYGGTGTQYDNNSSAPVINSSLQPNEMGSYSLDNPRHPLLAIIELNETVNTSVTHFEITATTTHYYLGQSENGVPKEALVSVNNPLSSIIRFSSDHFEEKTDIATGTATYQGSNYNAYVFSDPDVDENKDWNSFVELTKSGEDLLFTRWKQEVSVIDSDDFGASENKKVAYVSIIFDYYDDAINFVYNMYLGNSILNAEFVHFSCDWTLVI